MSVKHYCDGCRTLVTPTNRIGRRESLEHHFPETEVDFSFDITFSSNAAGGRLIAGDGDLCKLCLLTALQTFINEQAAQGILAELAANDEAPEDEDETDDDDEALETDPDSEEAEDSDD